MQYVQAMRKGLDKFTGMLPILVEQKIHQLASEKLNSTRDAFLEAVKVDMTNYLLVVEIEEDDWLANAVESGADPFTMKDKHLRSPKAKRGKPGKDGKSYRYMRIPIGKKAGGPGGSTNKSQEFQKKINQVMQKPSFGMSKFKSMIDGSVVESQQVLTNDPDMQGLYRTRSFDSAADMGQKRPTWNLIMFRTMSENPNSKSKWEHPGIKPANILQETEQWLLANGEQMLDTFIQNEVNKVGG